MPNIALPGRGGLTVIGTLEGARISTCSVYAMLY